MNATLLWVDDEIDLLRPLIIFLQTKGYNIHQATNGQDALDMIAAHNYDLILLDEHMPGLSGLDTLSRIKTIAPTIPVVMVTKSEEENIMNQAIGQKIADYLIKPVNPNQVLLALKKNIHQTAIQQGVAQTAYLQEYPAITQSISQATTFQDWQQLYRRLVYWELELSRLPGELSQMLLDQKNEANRAFAKFIRRNYQQWFTTTRSSVTTTPTAPLMSHQILPHTVFPLLDKGEKVFLLIIDNFRLDQWRAILPAISDIFNYEEQLYLSILPTVTEYARNAICAGLMPLDIRRRYPNYWHDEGDDEEGRNLNEAQLLASLMKRNGRTERFAYHKLNDSLAIDRLLTQFHTLQPNNLNLLVINFIDILSHAKTEHQMVHELVGNEQALRSITLSWFQNTSMRQLLQAIARTKATLIITTDHGSKQVDTPVRIIADRQTNTNLRFKLGRNLHLPNPRDIVTFTQPQQIGLPTPNISTTYAFTTASCFFAYPNNYNYYATYYRGSFQHGGISLEEMIIPLITLHAK